MTLLLLPLLACSYQENVPEVDISGTVVVPRAAATRTEVDDAGNETEVVDQRIIGPVILGAFSGIDRLSFGYPHPAMGPVIEADTPGDAFPYGGTTVGRIDFACYEALSCRVATGRFADYADILDYFANVVGIPVTDPYGTVIDDASTFQQYCYEYFEYTSDQEMSFIGDLDFEENADGDFEAEFFMPHTQFVDGMTIWGWMDAPAVSIANPEVHGTFSSCNADAGRQYTDYDQTYYEGRLNYDLLNLPSMYINWGDWVADGEAVLATAEDTPTVNLSFYYGEEE